MGEERDKVGEFLILIFERLLEKGWVEKTEKTKKPIKLTRDTQLKKDKMEFLPA